MKKVLVVHGPNLNLLGEREPGVYGTVTLESINRSLEQESKNLGLEIQSIQSNHEGTLIDAIQDARTWASALIVNPGGLAHSSVSMRDAISAARLPAIEVHLSNIFAREEFRRRSITADACRGVIAGFGAEGYLMALRSLSKVLLEEE
jgi:3-dehydroquinate dehydratase-2